MHLALRSSSQTAPISSSLQKSADPPIISLAGLLRLAEWIQSRKETVQGGDPCHGRSQLSLPPRPVPRGAVDLNQLWCQLTEAKRKQTLATLSGIVARQLAAPLDEKEVRNERS